MGKTSKKKKTAKKIQPTVARTKKNTQKKEKKASALAQKPWWELKPYRRSDWYKKLHAGRVKRFFFWFLTTILVGISAVLSVSFYYLDQEILSDLPDPTTLSKTDENATTKIYDRHNHLLYSIYDEENRTPISLSDVALVMQEATIAIEDSDFYEHPGFSISGILRAFIANLTTGSTQGGSTITQQLVKNRLLNNEKTLDRKVKELILALLTDAIYTKEQILEMYLNTVSYGGTIYGIEQASVSYFGKNASNLDLAEAAYLASITKAPSVYSPYAGSLDMALLRQKEVLRRMEEDGYITHEERLTAEAEELQFMPTGNTIEAPHFVMYVKEILMEMYGEQMVESGGFEVITSLDLELQNQSQEILTQEVDSLKRMNIQNGASMITNPQTGEVLTMVGSRDYWDIEHDGQVNVTLAQRQPGSSIKPLTYALSFMKGLSPSTRIDDAPITFSNQWESYSPKNYDGKFHGSVTLRESLGSSYNIPAVKLINQFGVNNLIDLAEKMGITTWGDRSRFGLSLTLGAGEVRMADMAVAYGHFANGGYRVPLNPILEIRDRDGQVIYENTCAKTGSCLPEIRTIPASVAYEITSVLSDNKARTPAFGAQSVLIVPGQEVAVKTGTTNNLRDNWTIGYTTDREVLVWVGNNDNTSMSYVASGITGASPIWQKTMLLVLDPNKPHTFEKPDSVEEVQMCGSGYRLCRTPCQVSYIEYFDPSLGQTLPKCYIYTPPVKVNPPVVATPPTN